MGQRTIDCLFIELRKLDANGAPRHDKLRSAFSALQNYRLNREDRQRLSDTEWVGILLSARDLLEDAIPDSDVAREVIELAIQTALGNQSREVPTDTSASRLPFQDPDCAWGTE